MDLLQQAKIINDSAEIIKNSKNSDVVVGRINTMRECYFHLLRYEWEGIPICDPLPSKHLQLIDENHDKWIVKAAGREYSKTIEAVINLKTANAKRTRLTKFLDKLKTVRETLDDPANLEKLEMKAQKAFEQIEIL